MGRACRGAYGLTIHRTGATGAGLIEERRVRRVMMSSRVRLPLVEPKSDTKANIAAVLADDCEQHFGYMIGNFSATDCLRKAKLQLIP